MHRVHVLIVAVVIIGLTTDASSSGDMVEQRQAAMKDMRRQVDVAEAMLKNRNRFDLAAAEAVFRSFAENGQAIAALFPEGSDRRGSRARAAVWSDRARFEAALASFNDSVSQGALNATTPDGFRRAYTDARQECRSCHQRFRAR